MIRIQRNDEEITRKTRQDTSKALRELESAVRDKLPVTFDEATYRSWEIRQHLWESQHFKCCYCERSIGLKFQHVEHFRPKARVRRSETQTEDGYWWLAYTITNLLYACPECNNYKQDWFPLEPGSPKVDPGQDPELVGEKPTMIDPLREDPEDHLFFDQLPTGQWRISSHTERGWETITKLHLDSDTLDKQRRSVARKAERRAQITSDSAADVADDEHFAGLIRSVLRSRQAP